MGYNLHLNLGCLYYHPSNIKHTEECDNEYN